MSGSDDFEKVEDQDKDVKKEAENNTYVGNAGVEIDAQKAREFHEKRRKYIVGIASAGVFIALTIISAQISISITPTVAFTLQFLVTNICCLLLGKKWGTLTVFLYILLGLFGLPIFSAGGGGIAYVLKPSFGFLIGMMLGGLVGSWFREKTGKNSFVIYLFASLIDMVIMHALGVAYGAGILYGYMRASTAIWDFLMMMLIPFIPIDIVKCVIGALICPKLSKYSKL